MNKKIFSKNIYDKNVNNINIFKKNFDETTITNDSINFFLLNWFYKKKGFKNQKPVSIFSTGFKKYEKNWFFPSLFLKIKRFSDFHFYFGFFLLTEST